MDVFFWDSPRLDYEVSHDCDFVISGETFGRSAYSIGLTKGSFWTEHVTMQLLDLTESGYMEVSVFFCRHKCSSCLSFFFIFILLLFFFSLFSPIFLSLFSHCLTRHVKLQLNVITGFGQQVDTTRRQRLPRQSWRFILHTILRLGDDVSRKM